MIVSVDVRGVDVRRSTMVRVENLTPSSLIREILEKVLTVLNIDSSKLNAFALLLDKKVLDLTLPIRFAGFPNNPKLYLVYASKSNPSKIQKLSTTPASSSSLSTQSKTQNAQKQQNPTLISVAIRTESQRIVLRVSIDSNLMQILQFAAEKQGISLESMLQSDLDTHSGHKRICVVIQNNQKMIEKEKFESVTLKELGFVPSDSVLLELQFESPINETNQEEVVHQSNADSSVNDEHFQIAGRDVILFSYEAGAAAKAHVSVEETEEDDSFFELTQADLLRLMNKQENTELETKKMRAAREAAQNKGLHKFKKCSLRIRLPDGTCIQSEFEPEDTLNAVYNFVAQCVQEEWKQSPEIMEKSAQNKSRKIATKTEDGKYYYLYVTPPVRRLDDLSRTLLQEKFVPSAILLFGTNSHSKSVPSKDILRPELLDKIQHAIPAPSMSSARAQDDLSSPSREVTHGKENTEEMHQLPVEETKKKSASKVPKWFKPK
mmetsp:Transcript_71/g.118  ORF Transcript_71/g.118 Transcript_71/m.118 type:complete len:492 (-) Transcript_71:2960-4435(-)